MLILLHNLIIICRGVYDISKMLILHTEKPHLFWAYISLVIGSKKSFLSLDFKVNTDSKPYR